MREYLLPCPLVRGTFQVEKKMRKIGKDLSIAYNIFGFFR